MENCFKLALSIVLQFSYKIIFYFSVSLSYFCKIVDTILSWRKYFACMRNKICEIISLLGGMAYFILSICYDGWTDKDVIHQAWSGKYATKKSLDSWCVLHWRIAGKWGWKWDKPLRQYWCSLHPLSPTLISAEGSYLLFWCTWQCWQLFLFYGSFCPLVGVFCAKFCVPALQQIPDCASKI